MDDNEEMQFNAIIMSERQKIVSGNMEEKEEHKHEQDATM